MVFVRGSRILGYVSTMRRDNPYIDLTAGGYTLNCLDRVRLLKDLKAVFHLKITHTKATSVHRDDPPHLKWSALPST